MALEIHFSNNYPKLILEKAEKAKEKSANIKYYAYAYGDNNQSYNYKVSMGYADPEKKYENCNIYDGYYYLTSITEESYSWKFEDNPLATQLSQHGEYSYGNLIKGSANIITGTCTVSAIEMDHYDRTEIRWEYIDNEIIGYEKDEITGEDKIDEITGQRIPIYKEPYYKENSTTISDIENEVGKRSVSKTVEITVYTSPGSFTDYNFSKDIIIQSNEGLSATKVSKWCTHAGKYLSWRDQDDRYDDANSLKVINYFGEEKPIIRAAWYNDCAKLVGCTTRVSNKHNQADSLITAQIFKDLGAAISP